MSRSEREGRAEKRRKQRMTELKREGREEELPCVAFLTSYRPLCSCVLREEVRRGEVLGENRER